MTRMARKSEVCEVKIGNEVLGQVDAMKYLVVMISSDGSMEREVEARIGSATRMTRGMKEIVEEKGAEQEHQTEGCKRHSHAILMHGCETLSLSKQQQTSMERTAKRVLVGKIEGKNRG